MRRATVFFITLFLLTAGSALAQQTDYMFEVPLSGSLEIDDPFYIGAAEETEHSGARSVTGPYDLDGDGNVEVLLTDYTGGGRVHVIENRGVDTWELVYSTPWLDSTGTVANARYALGTDLDDDGNGEILFITGHGFSADNPLIDQYPIGMYMFEHTGTDDDYGAEPAFILEFETDTQESPTSVVSEQFAVEDVDGDGTEEILVPGNSGSEHDYFYIYSVTGGIGTGLTFANQELAVNPRNVDLGSGSPYGIHPADLDGDGTYEISFHSWSAFNLFNADVTGADTYVFGDTAGVEEPWLHATAELGDHVSLFSGVVVDMDGNGDDEVYYPDYHSGAEGNVHLLNYEDGEDVLDVEADNVVLSLIPNLAQLGIAVGDLDNDGNLELMGSGLADGFKFGVDAYVAGERPGLLHIAEFSGGDVEDPANYQVSTVDLYQPFDTLGTNFDLIHRDSLGVDSTYYEETGFRGKNRAGGKPGQGELYVSKLAYLDDADGDGSNEVALAFQGIDDSTYVINEVWNADSSRYERTIAEARPVERRTFLRVVSGGEFGTDIVNERVVMPDDYKLHGNFPNPFNDATTMAFELPLEKRVTVRVYDVLGRVVTTLVDDERYAPGIRHQVTWDGTNDAGQPAASGMYVYTLEWGNFKKSRTMLRVK